MHLCLASQVKTVRLSHTERWRCCEDAVLLGHGPICMVRCWTAAFCCVCLAGKPSMYRVAKWNGDSPEKFNCSTESRLAEPLLAFFTKWKGYVLLESLCCSIHLVKKAGRGSASVPSVEHLNSSGKSPFHLATLDIEACQQDRRNEKLLSSISPYT